MYSKSQTRAVKDSDVALKEEQKSINWLQSDRTQNMSIHSKMFLMLRNRRIKKYREKNWHNFFITSL